MVSSLHSSVLTSYVPTMGSVNSSGTVSSSSSAYTSTATTTSTSSYDTTSFSSTGMMMAAEGSSPPDFDSMSLDEFCDHLVDLQDAMAENGVDISTLVDPTTLSDDELSALKDEMSSMGSRKAGGKQGPPPPPPPSSTSSTEDTDEVEETTWETMLAALEAEADEDTQSFLDSLL